MNSHGLSNNSNSATKSLVYTLSNSLSLILTCSYLFSLLSLLFIVFLFLLACYSYSSFSLYTQSTTISLTYTQLIPLPLYP